LDTLEAKKPPPVLAPATPQPVAITQPTESTAPVILPIVPADSEKKTVKPKKRKKSRHTSHASGATAG